MLRLPACIRLYLFPLTALALALGAPVVATGQAESLDPAALAFERFKSLAGTWRADSTKGWSEDVTFEVIARGSVVMSTTTFHDAPDRKMVTMYSLDGGNLVATHYCEARNQPHLAATEIDFDATTLRFTFVRGGNLASRDTGHMDQAVFRFLDENEFISKWTWYQDGNEDWMEEIHYRRLR